MLRKCLQELAIYEKTKSKIIVNRLATSYKLPVLRKQNTISALRKQMKFFVKNLFSECEQIHSALLFCSHLLNFLKENFIFCAVMTLMREKVLKRKYLYETSNSAKFNKEK